MTQYLIQIMTMVKANIREIKARFSRYVEMAESGETVIVCKRNLPVARLCPIETTEVRAPVLGAAKGAGRILPSFHDPMAEEDLSLWEGRPDGQRE